MRAFNLQSIQGLRQVQSRLSRQSSWIRPGCRVLQTPTSRWSSSNSSATEKEKPYYVTTPIFYVNAAPHIGHLYTMVLTDVLKRWKTINGKEAYLCTGTDEHGMKIQQAALKEGISPKELCDNNSNKFRDLAEVSNISHDFFIRTTDQEHKDVVQQFWLLLKARAPEGLGLYKGKHEGWYCVSDECFYPEDLVEPSVVPQTGRKIMASTETGNEVEWIAEHTWFFPLSRYKDKLLRFYDENPDWIQPAHRMNEVRNWVENHLEDLSVTRPTSRLNWGIRDPDDPTSTIYVWVDALVNYLTKAGFGTKWHADDADTGIWPADVHVVGKDIIRFHAVYWPALLMAAGLPLPKKILCHNHWTMSNRKMSKSLGNVVNPFSAVQKWDLDPLRYFLMRNGSLKGDMSYSNESIMVIYEKELQANIGNLFNRISRNKNFSWSTLGAVQAARNGDFDNIESSVPRGDAAPDFFSLESTLHDAPTTIRRDMDEINLSNALRGVFELLREANRFISDTEPWKMTKSEDPNAKVLINWVIYECAEAVRIAGILLQPIMPTKAEELLDNLGVDRERRTVEFARKGADTNYGTPPLMTNNIKPNGFQSLFPPVAAVDLPDAPIDAPKGKGKVKNRLGQVASSLAQEARETISTSKALLVPYEAHHVRQYHAWMQDPDIQEATASEPMTLEEEYENQQSWRTSSDKLTFIVCAPATQDTSLVKSGTADADALMRGDINFFLYPFESDDEDDTTDTQGWVTGEVDVMIASPSHRGQGLGQAAVCALLAYIRKHIDGILAEYGAKELKGLMVKIKEGNKGSRALFEKLGFVQKGEVNYFGEVLMTIEWDEVSKRDWWTGAEEEFREVKYELENE
ncbi:unnamed protein product [Fusarium graminearum]|uniref:Probable methionine--tRNA ligase, mitochondrial n=1 Tax=Gibberella zeae TaxID=5518 RepID=A0A4U9FDZ3_GIBZA|nr:hypothetical protein FG05_05909 [Fusarium graminearum]CAG1987839.1 unnamed protein product [Fusarium graminearum]CAG2001636.1 unnamed protein product [Fusarium graminearum]CZS84625.1 unnamed protein product [Fusarium graminearum]VTO93598.1 unnamed protein product [Fusarium graminearum]